MQDPFSCVPATFAAIEAALSSVRLARYQPGVGGDKQLALRIYIWNARLCEQFLIPLQFAEVTVRNRINSALTLRFGTTWHSSTSFLSPLPERQRAELARVIQDETGRHGALIDTNRIVSGLSFGFWVHLTSQKCVKVIWGGRLPIIFPHKPTSVSDQDIYKKIDQLRHFRNRVAHHNAIFDKKPTREFQNVQDIIGWACPETLWLMRHLSNPAAVIAQRPRY
jgi:hypothetical protein